MASFRVFLLPGFLFAATAMHAVSCATQAAMPQDVKSAMGASALELGGYVASGKSEQVRARTIPAYASDEFGGIQSAIQTASPHLQSGELALDSLWLLDASDLKPGPDGKDQDAQFFCSLKQSVLSVTVNLASLPQGRYGLAILNGPGAAPWRLAVLMQEIAGRWQLAGLFPSAMTMGGHDGLYYWKQARIQAEKKQSWNAWIHYQLAHKLLQPAPFLTSSHLDKLEEEMSKSAPPALSHGISKQFPQVVKSADGKDVVVTAIAADDSLGDGTLDVGIHIHAEAIADPAQARARNRAAALAFVNTYPELREAFHGIWTYADAVGQPSFPSEEAFSTLK